MTTEVQTCYRHADRRAGVQCQRCGRAICPSCMQQASVGFHCPECMRSSGQRVYTSRTLRAASSPIVTSTLVAANVVIYLVSTMARFGTPLTDPSGSFVADWGLVGRGFSRFAGVVGVADGEWYRLVSGGFLHGGLLHLGFNMFALWILGRHLEGAVGRVNFAAVYASSLLAGSLGVMVLDPNQLTVGASGAVFGLFGYALVAQWARGINPMDTGLGAIIFLNLVITFTVPGISIGGHVGGLIGGVIAGGLIDVVRPRTQAPPQVATALVVALGAVCFGASLAVAGGL